MASGFAAWKGFHPTTVRIAFVIAAIVTSGIACPFYVAGWLFIPADGESDSIAHRARADARGLALATAVAVVAGVLLVLLSSLSTGWFAGSAWTQVFTVAGLVLIWRNGSAAEQASLKRVAEPLANSGVASGRFSVARLVLAAALVLGGAGWLASTPARVALLRPLGGSALVIAGVVVLFGPWWLRIARDLSVERRNNVRLEERTEIASRIHDSVLQTLALIQRRADDPQKVIQLARAQERELRAWLFEDPSAVSDATVAAGIKQIQQDVEARYEVPVEIVTVGDRGVNEALDALLAAAREATVNAAKWSGAKVVSVYAEAGSDSVTVVVRDRGKGFDPAAVSPDRKGLAESIRGRMTRFGGTADVSSERGEGTKSPLTMPVSRP